jgi:hypothetical protein
MSLLGETYRKFDPEGEVNLAFNDDEVKETIKQQQLNRANANPFTKKNILDA